MQLHQPLPSGEDAPEDVQPCKKLRRSKQFEPTAVELAAATKSSPSTAVPAVKTGEACKRRKTEGKSKYELPGEPSFAATLAEAASREEPPNYAAQGSDAGKKRGRPKKAGKGKKPKKHGKANKKAKRGKRVSAKAKAKATSGKGKKNAKGNAVKKTGPKQVDAEAFSGTPTARKSRAKKPAKAKEPELADLDGAKPEHYGPLRTPPAHITANHVYSSAYRKNAKQGDAFGRMAGQMAAAMFRETGQVDELCGVFRNSVKRSS